MSIKRKVSVFAAIQMALDNMSKDETIDMPLYTEWAMQAENHIGSYYAYKRKIYVLDICQCSANLPCEVKAVMGILIGDHGTDCNLKFPPIYNLYNAYKASIANGNFLTIDLGGENYKCVLGGWHIQNNSIIFDNDVSNIDKITIETLAYEVDADGFPMVNENHIDAIAQYIEYKEMLRNRWRKTEIRFQPYDINLAKIEWGRKCRNARAEDAEPSPTERQEITDMINNPTSGIGIALWKYNDNYYGRNY